MTEPVQVRCPTCRREHSYAPPTFPCPCGAPVAPPLDHGTQPTPLRHRTWSDSWVSVRCTACGRQSEWPHPELGCPCGAVVQLPVRPVDARDDTEQDERDGEDSTSRSQVLPPKTRDVGHDMRTDGGPTRPQGAAAGILPAPGAQRVPSIPRPAFRPVTIRTARDAVAAAALYLRWLGFHEVRQPDARPSAATAVDLRAPGLVAQVDPTTIPVTLRAVECVWLNGLTASATSAYFALAGYTHEARARAEDLQIPLFVLDLTGTPQPVNAPAEEFLRLGA
ncbi:hypothetical protein [Streptomyces sp. NPDC006879]|uniref:hypothetical protein n=1 Tax=Streptomyces sp. NPDC006879 TaxID=3364767 RepID=UPI0036BE4DA9